MMIDRRALLVGGAVAGASLAITGPAGAASPSKASKAKLRICSQEGRIPGNSLREKVLKMEKWGIEGLEVGGGGLTGRIQEVKDALKGTSVQMGAVCAGFRGALISDDPAQREAAVQSIKEILSAAGELGATGMIVVPAFNGQTKLGNQEARKVLLDLLPGLGEHAANAGTRVLLEPLNRGEAFFLRQLADAAAICRDANSPGVCMMGDFYHMAIEETSDMGAFISGGQYLHHVHLASRRRNLPGQDDRDFTDGFRGLKWIGYQDFCSFECGCIGDPEVEIPKSVKFLRDQWAKATL